MCLFDLQPFPHVAIDNFFPEEFARAISAEYSDDQRQVIDAECMARKNGQGVSKAKIGVRCPQMLIANDHGKSGVSNPAFMQVHAVAHVLLVQRRPVVPSERTLRNTQWICTIFQAFSPVKKKSSPWDPYCASYSCCRGSVSPVKFCCSHVSPHSCTAGSLKC